MSLSSAASIFSLGDLMWADFWWRFPDLVFSLTEGDIGWIPYFLQRAEHIQDRHSGWTGRPSPRAWDLLMCSASGFCAVSSTTQWE